jgi:hypothetical protein
MGGSHLLYKARGGEGGSALMAVLKKSTPGKYCRADTPLGISQMGKEINLKTTVFIQNETM